MWVITRRENPHSMYRSAGCRKRKSILERTRSLSNRDTAQTILITNISSKLHNF